MLGQTWVLSGRGGGGGFETAVTFRSVSYLGRSELSV